MKTFTNIGLFVITYFMVTILIWVISMDKLTWFTIAQHPLVILFGSFASIMTVVSYRIEKDYE